MDPLGPTILLHLDLSIFDEKISNQHIISFSAAFETKARVLPPFQNERIG
jgi:hypothetical protein